MLPKHPSILIGPFVYSPRVYFGHSAGTGNVAIARFVDTVTTIWARFFSCFVCYLVEITSIFVVDPVQADQSNHKPHKRVYFCMFSIILQSSVSYALHWPMSVCCFVGCLVLFLLFCVLSCLLLLVPRVYLCEDVSRFPLQARDAGLAPELPICILSPGRLFCSSCRHGMNIS